jgi:hypothetical protein
MAPAAEKTGPDYWMLISILFSSIPMEQALAMALHRVAFDLYANGQREGGLDHQWAHGKVTNSKTEAALGSITGPVFEAQLETERGKAEVRFILTRQGLEMMMALEKVAERPSHLN